MNSNLELQLSHNHNFRTCGPHLKFDENLEVQAKEWLLWLLYSLDSARTSRQM